MTEEEKLLQHQKLASELDKIDLEKQKLAQEIKHLKRHLLLTPQYVAPIASTIIAVLAFVYASYIGLWDNKKAALENQKFVLQIDIDKFSKQKDSIKTLVLQSQQTLDSLNIDNTQLKTKLDLVKKQLTDISIRYKADKKSIIKELDEIDKLLKANNNSEAFIKLTDLVNKLNGITGRSFSNDFNDDFK